MKPTVIVSTLLAIIFLTGCIPLPALEGQPKFEGVVGLSGSKAPCEVGTATVADVVKHLGPGTVYGADDTIWYWSDRTVRGMTLQLYPLMHAWQLISPDYRDHYLFVRVDRAGRIRNFQHVRALDEQFIYPDEATERFAGWTAPRGWKPRAVGQTCPLCQKPLEKNARHCPHCKTSIQSSGGFTPYRSSVTDAEPESPGYYTPVEKRK